MQKISPKNKLNILLYFQVGSYNDTDYLKIDARYDPKWYAPCEGVASCTCPFPEYQPSRYMLNASDNQLNVVYLSDIHESDPNNPYACGKIDTGGNFQNLMAFFYALNVVNQYVNLPATLKLGGLALDTCSTPGRIGQDLYSSIITYVHMVKLIFLPPHYN